MDFSSVDESLNNYLPSTSIPGLSLAISDREKTLHSFTYTAKGLTASPITSESLFEIGSISKSFTSILLQQLVDAGKLDLHRPITDYLSWLTIPIDYEAITTHHLLSHSAGIINGTDFSGEALAEVYALRESPTASPPGTFFHYSNVGYKVLGILLEKLTGQNYPELLRERILKPLGMNASYPSVVQKLRSKLAVGYVPHYDDRPAPLDNPIVPANWLETATADGSIVSSPSDLAIYMRMLMNGGHDGILSREAYQRMIQPVIEDDDGHYGYGLWIGDTEKGRFIGHSGGMVGYTSQILWHVENGLGFVMMVNAINIPGINKVLEYLKECLAVQFNAENMPTLELAADPFIVKDAESYAGIYRSTDSTLTIIARENRLFLLYKGKELPLALRAENRFLCEHPEFELFAFVFERDDEDKIKSLIHGENLYMAEGHELPEIDYPLEWESYRGHYRSYNPWMSAFRVLLRAGKLYWQSGNEEELLVPLAEGLFRVGEDEKLPERLRFGLTIDGIVVEAKFNAGTYYRTFTP